MAAGLSLVAGGAIRAADFQPRSADLGNGESSSAGDRPDQGEALPKPESPTLSELFAASARDGGATGFLLSQLPRGKPLLWVQERMAMLEAGRIYPPGLGAYSGLTPELIHVDARDARTALWAMEEGLRCSALGAVIGEIWGDPQALDFTATRRLAVAAERHGVAAYLIRLGGHANLSGARMRWRVASAPSAPHPLDPKAPGSPAWEADLFRARGFAPATWIVRNDGATGNQPADRVSVAGAAGDRALAEGQRRVG